MRRAIQTMLQGFRGALSKPAPPAALAPEEVPAVFIDKDGTLIEDVPYNVDPALIRFTSGAIPALRMLASAGLPLVIVTNQPGLASGRFTRGEFARLQQALVERVREEAGVELAGFYVCPHGPGDEEMFPCLCRKPAPGLLIQASVVHHYDLSRSWMIGDILDDVEAGRRAGCTTILVDVGNETQWHLSPLRTPHHLCADFLEAARIVIRASSPPAFAESGRQLKPELP